MRLFFLFFSILAMAQTPFGYSSFTKLKITGNSEDTNFEKVAVFSNNKDVNYVTKANFTTYLANDFVKLAGAQTVTGVKTFENGFQIGNPTSTNVKLDYTNQGAFNITENNVDLLVVGEGFTVFGDYTNSKAIKLNYSANSLREVNFQDKAGTIALTSDVGTMPTVANSTSLPSINSVPVGTVYFVSGTGETFINNGSLWLGL